ncbi:MAG: GGDEF domain-containing protein [Candidatus Beckwithbacteria bacterium]|nr:GGDEF domain-containing protein [Candidatus Beckwithbacteria bacterium]
MNQALSTPETHAEALEWNKIINEQADTKAGLDELTGAYNRKGLRRLLRKMIAVPDKYKDINGQDLVGQKVAVLMLDLDHFKRINDMYGHGVGDRVLNSFARLLLRNIHNTDALVRVGGEEFLLILFGEDKSGRATYEGIDERLKELPILTGKNSKTMRVNFSAGLCEVGWDKMVKIAETDDSQLTNVFADVYKPADRALYQAKQRGRGQLVIASEQ